MNDQKRSSNSPSKNSKPKITIVNLLSFLIGFFLCGFIAMNFNLNQGMLRNKSEQSEKIDKFAFKTSTEISNSKHKLAIVVPFRDRFDELLLFVPHISKYLAKKSIDFKIYIVNQVDKYRFNRASLINVGFLFSASECDYMAMHDVDLLPLNEQLDYGYPLNNKPYHVSAPGLHPIYNYESFIGGILLVTKDNFLDTNGMSNRYWGWGKEDDEFFLRLKSLNITVNRPDITLMTTNHENTFLSNHDALTRPRDKRRYGKQREEALKKDLTGLDTLQYKINAVNDVIIGGYPCTVVNTQLFCNKQDTHWCDTTYQFID
jgi:xylosylprotein 4-beta-galactosyltransferase